MLPKLWVDENRLRLAAGGVAGTRYESQQVVG